VITTATGAVSPPITVGNSPSGLAITPDGKRAYVANNADGTVSVITTATGAVSPPITVGKGPGSVAITPDGKRAYVVNNVDGTVSVITTATGAVSAPITVGNRPIGVAITPDGKRAYVTNSAVDDFITFNVVLNGPGTVSVITTATGAVSPPITVGDGPDGVATCPARRAVKSHR
jgi:YVTN family beta-propeller protein